MVHLIQVRPYGQRHGFWYPALCLSRFPPPDSNNRDPQAI